DDAEDHVVAESQHAAPDEDWKGGGADHVIGDRGAGPGKIDDLAKIIHPSRLALRPGAAWQPLIQRKLALDGNFLEGLGRREVWITPEGGALQKKFLLMRQPYSDQRPMQLPAQGLSHHQGHLGFRNPWR